MKPGDPDEQEPAPAITARVELWCGLSGHRAYGNRNTIHSNRGRENDRSRAPAAKYSVSPATDGHALMPARAGPARARARRRRRRRGCGRRRSARRRHPRRRSCSRRAVTRAPRSRAGGPSRDRVRSRCRGPQRIGRTEARGGRTRRALGVTEVDRRDETRPPATAPGVSTPPSRPDRRTRYASGADRRRCGARRRGPTSGERESCDPTRSLGLPSGADHEVAADDRRVLKVVIANVVGRHLIEPAQAPVACAEREEGIRVEGGARERSAVRQLRRPPQGSGFAVPA